jgi:YVTN family beta-propeller protein
MSLDVTKRLLRSTLIMTVVAGFITLSHPAMAFQGDGDGPGAQVIPNVGRQITPTAPANSRFEYLDPDLPGFPDYVAGQAVSTVVSPNKTTLLILTTGYNLLNDSSGKQVNSASTEYVFVYDISTPVPVKRQVIQVPNTYSGIVFDPSGTTLYVSGGVDDDIHIYDLTNGVWAERTSSPLKLGHTAGVGLAVSPAAAGLAISADGKTLVVTNYYNDSITVFKNTSGAWSKLTELDLRPGIIDPKKSGVPGGEYPYWVVINSKTNTAYVSSIRDREIDVIGLAGTPTVTDRIKVVGQPNKMVLNAAGSLLYVAEDESDTIDIIDTVTNDIANTIHVGSSAAIIRPHGRSLTGNNTNSVTLSPDEKTLYVTNGNSNDVTVVNLDSASGQPTTAGLIPTGWYPTSVSLNANGTYMYVVNAKSPTGANPGHCHGDVVPSLPSSACSASNEYDLQLIKAGLQSFPVPTPTQLATLTARVAANNNFARAANTQVPAMMKFLQGKIKHVIYIIKENRTYDQILGDLPQGDGDPDLTEFGAGTTPNLHALASNLVTLDRFFDRSEVSMDGWPWSTSARAPDVVEKQVWPNYAGRGLTNDSEGTNRNVNVSYPTLAQRLKADPATPNDPNVLPGQVDTAAPDGPDETPNQGYLWDAALRAHISIRNYGFFIDLARYNQPAPLGIPELTDPAATKTQVAYSTSAALRPYTDPYFRGFDNSFPDYFRFKEWEREFDHNYAKGGLPQLQFVRLMHDHTGNFSTAVDGVNTPELQEADNDYAVGLLAEKISKSIYKDNTLIFVIEDDSQDGGDHVDAHRSIAFVIGPYVKHNALISSPYNTVDFVRTIEEVLKLAPMNLNDAIAVPMADIFDESQTNWSYTASPSALLAKTTLPIPKSEFAGMRPLKPTHDANYWAGVTKGMDFSVEDRINFDQYNHILWKGLMGDKPYPEVPTGANLRNNRTELLKGANTSSVSGQGGK